MCDCGADSKTLKQVFNTSGAADFIYEILQL